MKNKRLGSQTVMFENPPRIISSASIVSDIEGKGPLGQYFDLVLEDDIWGEKSWEKAECKMFENSVRMAIEKTNINPKDLNCLLGGDLLNQIISTSFAARALSVPFLGLYGACSTMAESLLIGSMLIDGGFVQHAACASSSHYSTAERQFRFPLELGSKTTPTSQRTVTGSGCAIIADVSVLPQALRADSSYKHIQINGGTMGKVIDLGIKDPNNMGAAMAPAAADTLIAHLNDTGRTPDFYDFIITGDLGKLGTELMNEICMKEHGIDITKKHVDCGCMVFSEEDDFDCGGSGCGCSAVVLNSYWLSKLESGTYSKLLFMATGALMSTTSSLQGESIPSIAHAVVIERVM